MTRLGRKTGIRRYTKYICKQCEVVFEDYPANKRIFCSKECHDKWQVGKKSKQYISEEEKERRKQRMMGSKNPMWKGGDSDKDRRNRDYKKWRITVFERDQFVCQKCGYFNGCGEKRRDLHAHHVIHWIDSIELRYTVENGITLCVPCHIKEHTPKD